MATVNFETSDAPHLTFEECAGDLMIIGSDTKQLTIEVDGEEDDLIADHKGETFTLTVRTGCYVTAPSESSLTVRQAKGNANVRCVKGPVAIEKAHGNVSLRDVGPAAVQSVAGNFEARYANGDLSLGQVSGNVYLRHIERKLALERCGGNLNARDLLGGVDAQVSGNIGLNTSLTSGCEYRLRANGNIKAYFPEDSSASCTFEAKGQLHCDLDLAQAEESAHSITGQLGAGEAQIKLHADGNVTIYAQEGEVEIDIEERIETMIEAELAELEQRLQEELADMGDVGVDIQDKARRKIEKASERARRQAQKAAERARRQAEKAAERARRQARKSERRTSTQAAGGVQVELKKVPEAEPVSSDERLTILRMVEEKKISASEASLLLDTLEGQS